VTTGVASGCTLLVAVSDFGWGSLGKLRLILDRLPAVDFALFGDAPINNVAADMLRGRHRLVSCLPERAAFALVINDPASANEIAEHGVPVIYVDSLPYLWSTPDEVPASRNVSIYCAQKYPFDRLPVSRVLMNRERIQWIDPIVPTSAYRRGGGGVVVNVGGLHSHLVGNTAKAYLRLALTPLLSALRGLPMPALAVCGNLPYDYRKEVQDMLPDCKTIGLQSPYEFEALLRNADLLITSPGSTTILQAVSLKLPTLLLPPQNLSQLLNARLFSLPSAQTMSWPLSVMQPDRIEQLRPKGEDVVLAYIYGSINAAAANEAVALDVAATIQTALRSRPKEGVLEPSLRSLGANGAAQVAQQVRQAMYAPLWHLGAAPASRAQVVTSHSAKPTLLVLRHHGLGDLTTAQPALHALRRRFPKHVLVATCPSWLVPLATHLGTADRWISETLSTPGMATAATDASRHQLADAPLLANVLREVSATDVLVSLRTPGPELLPVVEKLAPRLLVSYRCANLAATEPFPALDFTDHILTRWNRLLGMVGAEPHEEDVYLRLDVPESHSRFTIVHVGAGSAARLWPIDRWVAVAGHLASKGHCVIFTGSVAEAPRVSEVIRRASFSPQQDRSGQTDALELARLVAGARLVVSVDNGISHLATAFRRPALTLFGPVPPAWWGPPPGNPQHRTIWTGRTGDTYGSTADPGLLEISDQCVVNAIDALHRDGVV